MPVPVPVPGRGDAPGAGVAAGKGGCLALAYMAIAGGTVDAVMSMEVRMDGANEGAGAAEMGVRVGA